MTITTTTATPLDYSRVINTTAMPSYDCSISRYIDGDDVYIDGVRIKDYIDKKFVDAGSFHPDLDACKFKTVMGSF